jgi:hypothetical protein
MLFKFSTGILFFLFFILASYSSAQIPETGCQGKANMFSEAFAMHLQNNNREKMMEVLTEWELECGFNEPVFRARAIYLIINGDFPAELAQHDLLAQAIAFEIRYTISENEDAATREEYFSIYRDYFGHVPVNGNFDRRTQQKAKELFPRANQDELSFAFLTLYTGNTSDFFNMLKEGRYSSSSLSSQYFERVESLKRKPEFNIGITSGVWIPQGNLQIIGIKPSIGVFAGITRLNTAVNAIFEMRFGRTDSPVIINIKDTLIETRIHHGSYLGLEGHQIIHRSGKYRSGFFLSAGYNIVDIVEEALLEPERQTFGSWAFSGGLTFERLFSNRTRLGLHPGYILLNHRHREGSPLDGNAFVIKLIFGYSENAHKYVNLKRLGY